MQDTPYTKDAFAPIRKGLLEFLVLKIVSMQEVYAADIIKKLADTDFSTQEGTLYPLLSKMRRDTFLDYEWKESEAGPPRKYYRLTDRGKEQLEETQKYWEEIIKFVSGLSK